MMKVEEGQDSQSRMLCELSSLVMNILKSPPTQIEFSDGAASSSSLASMMQQITPAGFASLLLGISLALMLCGSVTFFIGFLLMPWVLGLLLLFYVVGIVSSLSMLARAILCYTSSPPSRKNNCSSWKLM